jgi:lysozyme family protein
LTDLVTLKTANAKRWLNARLTRNFTAIARSLVAAKDRYKIVQNRTGVPWFVIAVIHERESSQDWRGSLAQGDPWNRVSVHVPAGRGPFTSWEDAAVDALMNCSPHLGLTKYWGDAGSVLTALETYNGVGYANHGVPSPYVWAGTDQYRSGKYVADGRYDPSHIDNQPGCAGLLMAMMALDPTITFTGAKITPNITTTTISTKPSAPSITSPAKGSIGAWIASIFAAIFKRKTP